MEPLTLSVIGLSVVSAGQALASAAPDGVAGNFAYDLCKLGITSVVERAKLGDLAPNHELLRAARRSHLMATLFACHQYRSDLRQQQSGVQPWMDWCTRLAEHLEEEIKWTRSDNYRPPMRSMSSDDYSLLVNQTESGSLEEVRDRFEECVIGDLLAEIEGWHRAETELGRSAIPEVPEQFQDMLLKGWHVLEAKPTYPGQLLTFLTKRRGSAAESVRRLQLVSVSSAGASRVTWFSVFAAFFAEELKKNQRVNAIFNAKLLSQMTLERSAGRIDFDLEARRIGDALLQHLRQSGAAFTTVPDQLAELADRNLEILDHLATASSQLERDAAILREIAATVERIRVLVEGADEKLGRQAEAVAGVTEQLKSLRPTRRSPWQLPPRATSDEFFGRGELLRNLKDRLRSRSRTFVLGPAGFGKTALAAEALHELVGADGQAAGNPFSDGVVLIDLYRLRSISEVVWVYLADALVGADEPHVEPETRARRACMGRKVLIVIEGAEEAIDDQGRNALPRLFDVLSPENALLILTRNVAQTVPIETVRVDAPLLPDEAAALLNRLTGGGLPADLQASVLELLAGHPLALTWAGSLLARGDDDPNRLTSEWRSAGLPRLSDPLQPERTLYWLFERSTRRLDVDARLALQACGLLAHASVPLSAVTAVFPSIRPTSDTIGELDVSSRVQEAMKRLVQRSLLRRDERTDEGWRFTHVLGYQFGQGFAASGPDAATFRAQLCNWLAAYLAAALPTKGMSVGLFKLGDYFQHARVLLSTDNSLESSPLMEEMARTLNRLVELGQVGLAKICELAIRQVAVRDADSELVAMVEAVPLRAVEAFDESHWTFPIGETAPDQKVLLITQKTKEHIDTAKKQAAHFPRSAYAKANVCLRLEIHGQLLARAGLLEDALDAYRESLSIMRGIVAESRDDELRFKIRSSLEGIGRILEAQGKLDEALTAYRELADVRRSMVKADPDSALLAWRLSSMLKALATLEASGGRRREACAAARESLELDRKLASLAKHHPKWKQDLVNSEKLVNEFCDEAAANS